MADNRSKERAPLVVLGAGPGGYAAAFRAADLGCSVTLIDPEPNPGGVCLYRGCIPSKAYLHAAHVLREAEHASAWGIRFGKPSVDLTELRAWKGRVVAKMTEGLGTLCKSRGVRYVRGRGVLLDAHELEVQSSEGARHRLGFEHAILAVGSRPARPSALAADSERVMTSTEALELQQVPARLLVIGGGYIGLELATVYSALGSAVTVVEMTDGLLPGVDRDLVRIVARHLDSALEAIMLSTRVTRLNVQPDCVQVTLQGEDGSTSSPSFERVLVAVGRSPNSSGLGLADAGVNTDGRGFIEVDESRRTSQPHIFAIGDVAGEPMLAHKATHEGLVAAEVIAGKRVAFEPAAIPAVVFTDPEVAWCGLTEDHAKREGRTVRVARFPWQASGRATTLDRNDGLTKLVVDPQTERVLGAGIAGSGAGDLIAEAVLAIEMGAVAADLAMTIHPHPTLSETVMESADAFFGLGIHVHQRKPRGRTQAQ